MLDEISVFPKVLVFDLDDTLWEGEVDCTGGPPFTRKNIHTITSVRGAHVRLFPDVPDIFASIASHPSDMHVAYASRTWEPDWAKKALARFPVLSPEYEGDMWSVCSAHGWGDTVKTHHFGEIKKTLGIDFHDMMFFDNEKRNITEIHKLGAHCVYCPDGLDKDIFVQALHAFSRKRS